MVYFTALKIMGDEDVAKDIMQDTYIKIFSGLSELHDSRAFITWTKAIVVNLCKDHMKKHRPVLFASDEDEKRALSDIPEISEDFLPEEYADRREKSRLIMRIVDALPEVQRVTVILYYYDNLPISEVARITEVSEGTVKSRLNKTMCCAFNITYILVIKIHYHQFVLHYTHLPFHADIEYACSI